MDLVDREIARCAWPGLLCGCNQRASHLERDLNCFVRMGADFGIHRLEGHVFTEDVLFEPALPAVSICLAALASGVSLESRISALSLLVQLCSVEGQPPEVATSGRNLSEECITAARGGIPTLYSEVFSGEAQNHELQMTAAGYAFDTLLLIDQDAERVERCRSAAAHLLPWDLRPAGVATAAAL